VGILAKANAGATAYYVAVANGASAPSASNIKDGQDGEGQSALAAGSVGTGR
jgi:hypothetical protein